MSKRSMTAATFESSTPRKSVYPVKQDKSPISVTPDPINLFEFETAARQILPKAEYDYIAGGATDEISVDRNRQAYGSWAFRPRVLRDVSALDLSTSVPRT